MIPEARSCSTRRQRVTEDRYCEKNENIGKVGGLDGNFTKMKAKAKPTMTMNCRI